VTGSSPATVTPSAGVSTAPNGGASAASVTATDAVALKVPVAVLCAYATIVYGPTGSTFGAVMVKPEFVNRAPCALPMSGRDRP
jgi:hypothetical protein